MLRFIFSLFRGPSEPVKQVIDWLQSTDEQPKLCYQIHRHYGRLEFKSGYEFVWQPSWFSCEPENYWWIKTPNGSFKAYGVDYYTVGPAVREFIDNYLAAENAKAAARATQS